MFSGDHFDKLHADPALMVAIVVYIIVTVIFLSNLLIAQLNCSYQSTYQDMVGFARLNRGKIVTEAMMSVSSKRWGKFITALHLEDACEFGEGDIGLAGGIQVFMLGEKQMIAGWHPVDWQNHLVAHFDHRIIYRIMHFLL